MSNFSIICLHTLDSCLSKFIKVLKRDEYYFFNNWYELKEGILVKREGADFARSFFGENISIQAIVGKNGSGKSSILDLLYRLINNISYVAVEGKYRGEARRLYFIRNLNAEFFYELDGVLGSVRCEEDNVYFRYGSELDLNFYFASKPEEDEHAVNHVGKTRSNAKLTMAAEERAQAILKHFFYSLTLNYSIQGLVPRDYWVEVSCGDNQDDNPQYSWLDSIYDKNDGYLVPWGIEPYKGRNQIDLELQKGLTDSRISVLLIDTLIRRKQVNKSIDLISGYKLDNIYFYLKDMRPDKNDDDACADRQFLENVIANPSDLRCALFLEGYGIPIPVDIPETNRLFMELMVYIMEKTFNIVETYPSFKNFRNVRDAFFSVALGEDDFEGESHSMLRESIELIQNDSSHVSIKIRQAVQLARAIQFKENVKLYTMETFTYFDFIKEFYNKKYSDFSSPEEILEFYPPSIFEQEIYLKRVNDDKGFKWTDLSSGERLFATTSAAYLYHIRNILSVPQEDGSRIVYRHINLFLDEIELCYHPEYQRTFIHNLIESLNENGITNECNINILLTTHSPFVLSDIPKSNILFLRDGEIANDEINYDTFGANINDLLHKGFFLSKGFSGSLALEKINNIAKQLCSENRELDLEKILKTIDIVGDPLIRHQLYLLYDKYLGKYGLTQKKRRIEELKAELRILEG